MTEPKRGYAWRLLPCGHAITWDERLGQEPPCPDCDEEAFRQWAEGCGLVTEMAGRSGE